MIKNIGMYLIFRIRVEYIYLRCVTERSRYEVYQYKIAAARVCCVGLFEAERRRAAKTKVEGHISKILSSDREMPVDYQVYRYQIHSCVEIDLHTPKIYTKAEDNGGRAQGYTTNVITSCIIRGG